MHDSESTRTRVAQEEGGGLRARGERRGGGGGGEERRRVGGWVCSWDRRMGGGHLRDEGRLAPSGSAAARAGYVTRRRATRTVT